MIRGLDGVSEEGAFHCGTIANPIRQMEHEHDQAGAAVGGLGGFRERLREVFARLRGAAHLDDL